MASSNNLKRPIKGTNYATRQTRQRLSASDRLSISRSTPAQSQDQAPNINQQSRSTYDKMNQQYHHIINYYTNKHKMDLVELKDKYAMELAELKDKYEMEIAGLKKKVKEKDASRNYWFEQKREAEDYACSIERELKYATFDLNVEINKNDKANTTIKDLQNQLKVAKKRQNEASEDFKEVDLKNIDLKQRLYDANMNIEELEKKYARVLSKLNVQSGSEFENKDEQFWQNKYNESTIKCRRWVKNLNQGLKEANESNDELRAEILKLNQEIEDLMEEKEDNSPSVRGNYYNDGQSSSVQMEHRMHTLTGRDDGMEQILDEMVYKMGQDKDTFCQYIMYFERQRGMSDREKLRNCMPKILAKCQVMLKDYKNRMGVMAEIPFERFKMYRNYLAHVEDDNGFAVWFTVTDVRIVYNRCRFWMKKNKYYSR